MAPSPAQDPRQHWLDDQGELVPRTIFRHTRYCRTEGRDFIVGIQKDKSVDQFAAFVLTAPPAPVPLRNASSADARPVAGLAAPLQTQKPVPEPPLTAAHETQREPSVTAASPTGVHAAPPASAPAKSRTVPSVAVMSDRDVPKKLGRVAAIGAAAGPYFTAYDSAANYGNFEAHQDDSSHARAPQSGQKKEGTIMPSKWSDLAQWRHKEAPTQDAASTRAPSLRLETLLTAEACRDSGTHCVTDPTLAAATFP